MDAQAPETVRLVCHKCGRRLIVERKDITFARSQYYYAPAAIIAYAGHRELCCPFHSGATYWLEPEDHAAELKRMARARLANRLLLDLSEPWEFLPSDEELFWQLDGAVGRSLDYFDAYLESCGVTV